MRKPRIKVTEIKKDIKVTEIKKEEHSLEKKVATDILPPESPSSRQVNPTLAQHFVPSFTHETRTQVRQGIQGKDREFSYLTQSPTSSRSYDPSIKSERTQFLESRPAAAERVDPTIRSAGLLENQTGPSTILDVQQAGIEPSLRRFRDDDQDYRVERSVEKYMSKRRTE